MIATENNSPESNDDRKIGKHIVLFILPIMCFLIGSLLEIFSTYNNKQLGQSDPVIVVLTTIGLLAIPSTIHFWIWLCLRGNKKNDKFCKFFDRTMFFSVASFTIPQILFHIILLIISNDRYISHYWFFIFFGIASIITFLFLISMILMVILVNYDLLKNKDTNTTPTEGFLKWLGRFPRLDFWNDFFEINDLKFEMQRFPFWRALHFFAIFLSISYCFGLIFAFYDTGLRLFSNEMALVVENVNGKLPTSTSKTESNVNSQNLQTTTNLNPINTKEKTDSTKRYFQSNLTDNESNDTKMPLCFYFPDGTHLFDAEPKYLKKYDNASTGFDDAMKRKSINDESITKVVNFIMKSLIERTSDNNPTSRLINKMMRIELNGYADEASLTKLKDSYASNFELSSARNIAVQNIIYQELKEQNFKGWRQLEWVLFPHSNQKKTLETNCIINSNNAFQNKTSYWRVVEIYIRETNDQQTEMIWATRDALNKTNESINEISKKQDDNLKFFNSLQKGNPTPPQTNPSDEKYRTPILLDYLYFTIGVVTTNAAGDIKPAAPLARFLISIISFFQIFFLVGFFSTLLSLRNKEKNVGITG